MTPDIPNAQPHKGNTTAPNAAPSTINPPTTRTNNQSNDHH
ncbi:hypothetical protein [Geminisphaera colitermitum]|nr:hypothetical protein [Geminisphaera colitermitum]